MEKGVGFLQNGKTKVTWREGFSRALWGGLGSVQLNRGTSQVIPIIPTYCLRIHKNPYIQIPPERAPSPRIS